MSERQTPVIVHGNSTGRVVKISPFVSHFQLELLDGLSKMPKREQGRGLRNIPVTGEAKISNAVSRLPEVYVFHVREMRHLVTIVAAIATGEASTI